MILLYGAYGYTGKLIIDDAMNLGLPITLAGRNADKVIELAEKVNLPYAVFDLDNIDTIVEHLKDFKLVIHAAGPFTFTAKPMAEACIRSKTHYIDISGEFDAFEELHAMRERAKEADVMLLPGAGFDVVPSDCLAAQLKAEMPDATALTLAFTSTVGSLSRGTAKTMVENVDKGHFYRKNGQLVSQKYGKSIKTIDYGEFSQLSVGISWGDISTAFFSTSIPNIEVYTGSTPGQVKQLKRANWLKPILSWRWVKNYLMKKIDKKPAGPSDEKRARSNMFLWGKVTNGKEEIEKRLKTPNGYTLTSLSVVLISQKILDDNWKPGYQTPSSAYGKDLIFEIENCEEVKAG